jgi:hypothetical protein
MDYRKQPTASLATILDPHISILTSLASNPRTVENDLVPVKEHLSKQIGAKGIMKELAPFYGDLRLDEILDIKRWLWSRNLSLERKKQMKNLHIAEMHAATLVVMTRIRPVVEGEANYPHDGSNAVQEKYLRDRAWEFLCSAQPEPEPIDVDREALDELEERMFTRSKEAGAAGNYQWGMDVGPHQDKSDPYKWWMGRELTPYETETESEHKVRASSLD